MCCDQRKKCGCAGYKIRPDTNKSTRSGEHTFFDSHSEVCFEVLNGCACEEHGFINQEEHMEHKLIVFKCDCYIVIKYHYNKDDSDYTCEEISRHICDGHSNGTVEDPSPFIPHQVETL